MLATTPTEFHTEELIQQVKDCGALLFTYPDGAIATA
jgi:hypothetical protein